MHYPVVRQHVWLGEQRVIEVDIAVEDRDTDDFVAESLELVPILQEACIDGLLQDVEGQCAAQCRDIVGRSASAEECFVGRREAC